MMNGTTMAAPERTGGYSAGETGRTGPEIGRLAGIVALAGCGMFVAMVPPVSDHAYQFYMAGRVLDGARLYVDVGASDMHPPLFTWLAVAVTWIGRVVGLSGLLLFAFIVPVAAAASILTWCRLSRTGAWMIVVLALALLAMAGPYAGQGEHLALVLALPYLGGAAATAAGRPPARRYGVASAIIAGAGLAMKPHFALVWVGVELWLARRCGRRSLVRAPGLVVGATFVIYLVAAIVLTPELFPLITWVAPLYQHFAARPVTDLLVDPRMLVLIAGLAAGISVPREHATEPFARVLAIAALAMTAAVLLQGKGWGYHWYPVMALSVVLIGLAVNARVGRLDVGAVALAALAVAASWMQIDRTARLLAGPPVLLPQMADVVEKNAAGQPIVAFSYLLQTGFPLVNMTGTSWASPYAHLWMVPAMYEDAFAGRAAVRYRETGRWKDVEQRMFDRLWDRIHRDDPAVIILQRPFRNGFDMRAYFETDARFRDRFSRSPVLDTIGPYIILGRPSRG